MRGQTSPHSEQLSRIHVVIASAAGGRFRTGRCDTADSEGGRTRRRDGGCTRCAVCARRSANRFAPAPRPGAPAVRRLG
eukprot:4212175-Lingulodinium_polyedra.AAC.1